MNHDFDNEFETDDELKRGRSRRKEGRKYPSSGRTGRTSGTDSTGSSKGFRKLKKEVPDTKEPFKDDYHFYCGRDHCPGSYRRRLVWKAYDVSDADRYRV